MFFLNDFYTCLINLFQTLTAVETKLRSITLLVEEITLIPDLEKIELQDPLILKRM